MEREDFLLAHLRDLSRRAYQNAYLTHSNFLSEAELARASDMLSREGMSGQGNAPFFSYGGWEEAERRVLVFLPEYLTQEEFLYAERQESTVVALLHVFPRNHRFAEPLGHRDYLGSLMQLGLEREQIGDILVGNRREEEPDSKDEAYLYVMADRAELIAAELRRVRHSTVVCERVPLTDCRLGKRFRELSGSVASERLDAVLAMAYHLSRGRAQELIGAELVRIDGRTADSAGTLLREGQRVSARGLGKFLYLGTGSRTKKGRVYASVRLYV